MYNCNNEIEKHKAWLQTRLFFQKYAEDYDETFVPVLSHATIRTLLAAAVQKHINNIDVKTTFIHGKIKEDVYISHTDYKVPDSYIDNGQ